MGGLIKLIMSRIGYPALHKGSHQYGGRDEINLSGLPGNIAFVSGDGAQMAHIQEDDADVHYLDLAEALDETRNILAVSIRFYRTSGTGAFTLYPGDSTNPRNVTTGAYVDSFIIKEGTNHIRYKQVANDNWFLYNQGYIVGG